jgi:hypothetical protein
MEHEIVKTLLDKYWLAETTVEEEKALAAYFRQPDTDPRLEPFRDLFAYFEEEAKITPGEDFESRILERILREEQPSVQPRPVRRLSRSYAAAAAVILCIGIALMYQPNPRVSVAGTSVAATPAAGEIRDTYDDPQQALAAIRHALLTASVRMNQGKNITKKNMDRLSDTWQKTKNL